MRPCDYIVAGCILAMLAIIRWASAGEDRATRDRMGVMTPNDERDRCTPSIGEPVADDEVTP